MRTSPPALLFSFAPPPASARAPRRARRIFHVIAPPPLTWFLPLALSRRAVALRLTPAERVAVGFDGLLTEYGTLSGSGATILRHGACLGAARAGCVQCNVRDGIHRATATLSQLRGEAVAPRDFARTLLRAQENARRIAARRDATLSAIARPLSNASLALLAASGAIDLRETLSNSSPVIQALLRGLAEHDGTRYSERLPQQLHRLRSGTYEQLTRPPLELLACPITADAYTVLSGNVEAFRVLFALLAAAATEAGGSEGVLQREEMLEMLNGLEDEDAMEAVVLLLSRLAEHVCPAPAAGFARARPRSLAPRTSTPAPSASAAAGVGAKLRAAAAATAREDLLTLACSNPSLRQLRPLLAIGAFSDARTQRVAISAFVKLRSSDAVFGATAATAADTLHELMLVAGDQVHSPRPGVSCSTHNPSLPRPPPPSLAPPKGPSRYIPWTLLRAPTDRLRT